MSYVNEQMIDIFGMLPVADDKDWMDFARLNRKAVKLGYLVPPEGCSQVAWDWLSNKTADYNATFYKEWSDVLSKNRFDLFIDQLLHYSSTYGTDFNGAAWVPNDGAAAPDFRELKVVKVGTEADFIAAAKKLIYSGVALKTEVVEVVSDFLANMVDAGKTSVDLSEVKNREVQATLAVRLRRFPDDEFGILRVLAYAYTGKAELIKNQATIDAIKCTASTLGDQSPLFNLTDENLVALSRIFRRYKPIFLAMKTKTTAKIVNKLNKLAVEHHTPLKPGFWETVVSTVHTRDEIKAALEQVDNFKKVRILQAVNTALLDEQGKVYLVRNGKVFVRDGYRPNYDFRYLKKLQRLVKQSLVDTLSKKACRVKYPEHFSLALPSSQKSFIGNLPFGTSFKFTENNVVGIYWRNEWGTHDFDLSMTDYNGWLISWNSSYYANGMNQEPQIVYSGDMTDADPEATELLFIKGSVPDGIVRVNRYRGAAPTTKFRFFLATEAQPAGEIYNHMVDPNNIKLDTMVDVEGSVQKTVGLIHDNTFTVMDLNSGRGQVACASKNQLDFIKIMAGRTGVYVQLREILEAAGFVEDDEHPEIDFSNPDINTIIGLLAS